MNPADYGWTALTMDRATFRDIEAMRHHHEMTVEAADG